MTRSLLRLPFATARGVVLSERRTARFGTPSGGHDPLECWVYKAHESELGLLFAFYANFSADDLICKVIRLNRPLEDDAGATIQFNGDQTVADDDDAQVLRHHGRVTVGSPVARAELLAQIRARAPESDAALGGVDFPFVCGSTRDMGALLDRLFLYSYAVEQVKRAIRKEPALPPLYFAGPVEDRVRDEVATPLRGQAFATSAEARRAIELRAMDVAHAHLTPDWAEIQDVSSREPFDFLCGAGDRVLHVEVKGTTRDGSAILLTRNEVEHARTHPETTTLIVVSRIKLVESANGEVTATGGQLSKIEPWRVADATLVPLTYACILEQQTEPA